MQSPLPANKIGGYAASLGYISSLQVGRDATSMSSMWLTTSASIHAG
ncbi:hypothetical protein [Atlantibacter hermannii]|nr:hypothetical protein [Atlantibacter hermannii]MCQ4966461.1 hypothetical protein [Enterobacteriaceae bacterium DFI.7.85]